MTEWTYLQDHKPPKSGRYLISYADEAVTVGYYNKQQKKIFFEGDRDGDGNPMEISTAYAWAEVPKAARKI